MSEADRDKWQQMYTSGRYRARSEPGELVRQWLPVLPRGRALDIACGAGRHALCLAQNGYRVDAVDIADAARDRVSRTTDHRSGRHAHGRRPAGGLQRRGRAVTGATARARFRPGPDWPALPVADGGAEDPLDIRVAGIARCVADGAALANR